MHKVFQKGHIVSQETGRKISLAKMGHPVSKKTKKRISNTLKGRKLSEEHKRKIGRKGSKNPRWNGGMMLNNGYIMILVKDHPLAGKRGYIKRSHLIMEKSIERYIHPGEIVHHKGIKYPLGSIENKQDDRPENLQLFANHAEHNKFHYSISHSI